MQAIVDCNAGPWNEGEVCSSCRAIYGVKHPLVIPKEVEHTIPILSANFLLTGLVSLLTKVPSGYSKKQNGLSSFLASLPRDASWEAS